MLGRASAGLDRVGDGREFRFRVLLARWRSRRGAWGRSAALGGLPLSDRSGRFGGSAGGWSGEVAVAKAVGVALSARISAWWTRRSIMAAATMSSPKISPQPLNGLLEVTIRLARS